MRRNKFSLSHYKLLTADMGYLVPLTWYEAIPGDTIQHSTSLLLRVSPLLAPVMHPVRVRIHHWFVPNRLIWEDWEDFITGGADGDDETEWPYCDVSGPSVGGLLDYLGVPVETYSPAINISMLPARAYNLIWNEHYRDQDLVTEAAISTASGDDSTTSLTLKKVAWEKDYFTASRPWEQKGTEVMIPIGETAPVVGTDTEKPEFTVTGAEAIKLTTYSSDLRAQWHSQYAGTAEVKWGDPKLEADLTSATGVSVNDLRLAQAIQRYQEARAQYGSRYVEYLRHLGVRSSDARLQNPEYLGGGRQIIQFSEVLQTAEGDEPVASMKGHGLSAMRTNRWRRFFEEHGIVMTVMSVVPKTIYSQTLHKSFLRSIKEEYFQRELEFIGDQEVKNIEAYAPHSSPDDVFGYQSRYDEYRSLPSTIAGEFRDTLDHWHYARIHSGDIALNSSFVECTPTKRVNADTESDVLYCMANHSIQARRPLAVFTKRR